MRVAAVAGAAAGGGGPLDRRQRQVRPPLEAAAYGAAQSNRWPSLTGPRRPTGAPPLRRVAIPPGRAAALPPWSVTRTSRSPAPDVPAPWPRWVDRRASRPVVRRASHWRRDRRAPAWHRLAREPRTDARAAPPPAVAPARRPADAARSPGPSAHAAADRDRNPAGRAAMRSLPPPSLATGTSQRSDNQPGRGGITGTGVVRATVARTARQRSQSAACISAAARSTSGSVPSIQAAIVSGSRQSSGGTTPRPGRALRSSSRSSGSSLSMSSLIWNDPGLVPCARAPPRKSAAHPSSRDPRQPARAPG